MLKHKNAIWLLFFGSLWGISELVGGEALYSSEVPRASLWLSCWALFVLAVGRAILDKPGSSAAIGAIASVYRLANAPPFFCHICGILFLGIAFDLAATVLAKVEQKRPGRWILTGVGAAYGGNALFALIMTYVIRYSFWASAGLPKVLDHIFISGSIVALAAALLVPLGHAVGAGSEPFLLRRQSLSLAGALLLSFILWIIGGIYRLS